jgi:hypothetical protein
MSNSPAPVRRVETIPEAMSAMRDLGAMLPDDDGVGHFNAMYLSVTEAVASRLDAGMFVDPVFMDRLDVNFVNLYLDAYWAHTDAAGQPVSASWQVLFDRRSDARIQPLQFALAGMNAHISHDLPLAVTMTARDLDTPLSAAGVHEDFVAVNAILSDADDAVRASLQGPVVRVLDEVCGPLDDALGAWGIARAREAAWRKALDLWQLVNDPARYDRFLSRLDRAVAFAGHCLLAPAGGANSPHAVLPAVFDALDAFGDRVADLLWGDEVFDGEDDGFIGRLIWAARSNGGDLRGAI